MTKYAHSVKLLHLRFTLSTQMSRLMYKSDRSVRNIEWALFKLFNHSFTVSNSNLYIAWFDIVCDKKSTPAT